MEIYDYEPDCGSGNDCRYCDRCERCIHSPFNPNNQAEQERHVYDYSAYEEDEENFVSDDVVPF